MKLATMRIITIPIGNAAMMDTVWRLAIVPSEKIKAIADANSARPVPAWLSVNKEQLTGNIVELPKRDDIDLDVAEHLIVELYSK